ncbi:hypothetical protein Tco_0771446 [Tanacetum coccineum]|uniref:Uncharacterized protein n=1 Tax=Tanacetum coccineum TaxID=301880 RepID=A0ABQ4ZIF3_9ASTR
MLHRFFDYANYRIPFSTFFVYVLTHFRIPFSQLSVFGSAKVSHFEILCRVCNIEPDNLDSVKNWNDHFFWVDEFVVPANARFSWFSGSNVVKDRAPAPSKYNVQHVNTLIVKPSILIPALSMRTERVVPLSVLLIPYEGCESLKEPRAVYERPIVTVAKHSTVTLLPTSVVRSSGELSASVEREFVGDASAGDGGDQGFDMISAPQAFQRRKRATMCVVCVSEELLPSSHPPKRLRADYGILVVRYWSFTSLEDGSDAPGMSVATTDANCCYTVAILAVLAKIRVHSIRPFLVLQAYLRRRIVPARRKSGLMWVRLTKGFELNDGHLYANMIDHFTPPAFFKTVRGMEHEQLFTEFNVSAARNLSLSFEVRMHAEYNILEKRKWRSLAEEKNILLEANVSGLEATENSIEAGSSALSVMPDVLPRTRLAEIDADFTRCCMRFQESFHPHLLNVVAGAEEVRALPVLFISCHLGAKALSVALDFAWASGKKRQLEWYLIERLPFLKDVFVSIDDPLSAEALIEPPVEVPATNVLSTVVIVPHTDPSVSVEDLTPNYDIILDSWDLCEGEGKIDASARDGLTFSQLDDEARDAVL